MIEESVLRSVPILVPEFNVVQSSTAYTSVLVGICGIIFVFVRLGPYTTIILGVDHFFRIAAVATDQHFFSELGRRWRHKNHLTYYIHSS